VAFLWSAVARHRFGLRRSRFGFPTLECGGPTPLWILFSCWNLSAHRIRIWALTLPGSTGSERGAKNCSYVILAVALWCGAFEFPNQLYATDEPPVLGDSKLSELVLTAQQKNISRVMSSGRGEIRAIATSFEMKRLEYPTK
jgi:hypothetical protein